MDTIVEHELQIRELQSAVQHIYQVLIDKKLIEKPKEDGKNV